LFTALLAARAGAQEWTQFRGPNTTGISPAKGLPIQWTEKDFRWRVEVPDGDSQPVIWGDKIFLTGSTSEGRERSLVCLQKSDGKQLWVKTQSMTVFKKAAQRSYANGSPVVDKDRVVASFCDQQQYLVKSWDHSGKELWSANLGSFTSQHGQGSSPILYDGKVIVTNDQDGESFVAALDAKSGKQVWKTPRRSTDGGTAYCTPYIHERKGMPAEILLTSAAHGISSLDARTGAPLWEARVFDKRSVACAVVSGDLVFGSCGSGAYSKNYMVAVKLGGRGDVTSSHVAWKMTTTSMSPYVPTPLAIDGKLYFFGDKGFGTVLEAATGKVIWTDRIQGGFFSSPVFADGRIYILSREGEAVVLSVGDEMKVLARNPLGEKSHSTPCVDGDRLYLKTFTHLVCVGGK
jgi:outer membrane protein assembly factor BamB